MAEGRRVGILGSGQLGRMLALAGHPLAVRTLFVGEEDAPPAAATARQVALAPDSPALAGALEGEVDVLTYELEHLPVDALRSLEPVAPIRPSVHALAVASDRLAEKQFLTDIGLSTAPFARVDDEDGAEAAVAQVGLPALLKTRREGYDGKGQRVVRTAQEARAAARELAVPCIAEGFVRFRRELSVIAARGLDGEVRVYPLIENVHRDGVLRLSRAPAREVSSELAARAVSLARTVLEALDYVGVLTAELFESAEGDLLVNELAPRVHNSGHWTIEGAETSQFENHLRAILGWPLGSTTTRGESVMVNLLGDVPTTPAMLAIPGAHVHLYDKEPRAGRKLGHLTFVSHADHTARDLRARLEQLPEPLRAEALSCFDATT